MLTFLFILQQKYLLTRNGNKGAISITIALKGVKNNMLIALEYIFVFGINFQFTTDRLSPCKRMQTTV